MVTFTTSASHAFIIGNMVTIFGVTPGGYNGNYVVTSVPAANTFTVTNAASLSVPATAFGSASVAITEG